ncbi:hypothetical protein CWO90_13215 [Bradyrhizobium sp. Leo121]|nr:hypothetical protein CWO90_13215 [Bradyrhizobium sp. Leo121]
MKSTKGFVYFARPPNQPSQNAANSRFMPSVGHEDEPTAPHSLRHCLEVGKRNPVVPLTQKRKMRMPDLRYPSLQRILLIQIKATR